MPRHSFEPIHPNPYIAGNPIRTREMFFGRFDEFRFIARALEGGRKTALIVLFGERRSGKSSILYQILNGELGEAFLPIFVDMQIMAGITSDAEFFGRIITDACVTLSKNGLSSEFYLSQLKETTSTNVFRKFLQDLKARFQQRAVLLLIDEYEILEAKINEGCLSRNVLVFFAGLLETDLVSFVFTGSKSLEARDHGLWGEELFRKAMARKISFLTEDDAARLITQPLQNKVTFAPEVVTQIYALAAGQPFYTQMICQNLVYHLNEVEKYLVESADLQTVVDGIIENPPPQLLFNWSEHTPGLKLTLALLAEFSEKPETFLSARDLCRGINRHKLQLDLDAYFLNTELVSLFEDEYILQRGRRYGFRLDLYRRWVRHDHSIWQVKKEIGADELERITGRSHIKKEKRRKAIILLERVALIILAAVAIVLAKELVDRIWQKRVMVWANAGPYKVVVDDSTVGTTRGQKDSTKFEFAKRLSKGMHVFKAILLADSSEVQSKTVDIKDDNQTLEFEFAEYPVTIITNTASFIANFGGLEEINTKDRLEPWHYTFRVAKGKYTLHIKDPNTMEELDKEIAVRHDSQSIHIRFDRVVVLTFTAEGPFEYKYSWRDLRGRKKSSDRFKAPDAMSMIIPGTEKGTYKFIFKHSRTGKEETLENVRITTDTTITVKFETQPPSTRSDSSKHGKTSSLITHRLEITSRPSEAQIIVSDTLRGVTPFDKSLKEGGYLIKLSKGGYDTLLIPIVLTRDRTIDTTIVAQYGYLIVKVKNTQDWPLPDAKVYANERPLGMTTPALPEQKLLAGNYTIKVECSGYITEKKPCLVKKNEHQVIEFRLQKQ